MKVSNTPIFQWRGNRLVEQWLVLYKATPFFLKQILGVGYRTTKLIEIQRSPVAHPKATRSSHHSTEPLTSAEMTTVAVFRAAKARKSKYIKNASRQNALNAADQCGFI